MCILAVWVGLQSLPSLVLLQLRNFAFNHWLICPKRQPFLAAIDFDGFAFVELISQDLQSEFCDLAGWFIAMD